MLAEMAGCAVGWAGAGPNTLMCTKKRRGKAGTELGATGLARHAPGPNGPLPDQLSAVLQNHLLE